MQQKSEHNFYIATQNFLRYPYDMVHIVDFQCKHLLKNCPGTIGHGQRPANSRLPWPNTGRPWPPWPVWYCTLEQNFSFTRELLIVSSESGAGKYLYILIIGNALWCNNNNRWNYRLLCYCLLVILLWINKSFQNWHKMTPNGVHYGG